MGAFIRRHKTPKTQSERMTETAPPAERMLQQPVTVHGLNPLKIEHVRRAFGNAPQRAGADQAAANARRYERLEERNPVDAGAVHCHRLNVMFFEPGGDGLQVGGIIAEEAHRLGAFVVRHADHDLVCAEVHSGGVRVVPAHRGKRTRRAQAGIGLAEFARWGSSWKKSGRPDRFGSIAS